jgi:hypothetical protein
VISTGWTWEYIDDNMTLPRMEALNQYWVDNPPLHLLVRGLVGYKPPAGGSEADRGSADELVAIFGSMGGKVT